MKFLNVSMRASMVAALALGGLAFAAVPAWAQGVTSERLVNADSEPQNWLLPYRTYNSTSYSPLDEINVDNVKGLKVAFMTAIGGSSPAKIGGNSPGQRATPIVKDGFMYVANAWE